MQVRERIRTVLGSEITALCTVIFLADVVGGIVSPTLSLYARSLGLSLAAIGLLATAGGVTRLFTALPFGILSDRIGRPRLLRAGMLTTAVATMLYSMADGPALLFAGTILAAIGMVSTFQIGAAHLGDITQPGRRTFAFGCYATAMGLGFALGPLLGGQIAERYGTDIAYRLATGIALLGLVVALTRLHDRTRDVRLASVSGSRLLAGLSEVIRNKRILVACFGNMLMGLTLAGAVTTFFPLFGDSLSLTQATIGTLFAIRAFSSTLGRIPNGMLARRYGSQTVMLGALLLDGLVMFGIAMSGNTTSLMMFLALDGLAFGAYMVAGQTFLAENTEIRLRGSATGLYATASGTGSVLGTFALGLVASRWGVATVFPLTGAFLLAGFVVCLMASLRLRDSTAGKTGLVVEDRQR